MLDDASRAAFERDGFFTVPGFAPAESCRAMLARAVEIAREARGAGAVGRALVQPEAKLRPGALEPEDGVSKIFRLHRDEPVFAAFARDARLLALVSELLGPDLDCFLSQFIFKNPGALGQPWHQDGHYFPFDREPQVGVWLAVTEATLENGPLWALAGSHRDPIHPVVPDRREHANYGYVEIVCRDTRGAAPLAMKPGDLLVFHSRLMHRSTDNASTSLRAAMVYHYAQAGTDDRTREVTGRRSPVNDWMPVLRAGHAVAV